MNKEDKAAGIYFGGLLIYIITTMLTTKIPLTLALVIKLVTVGTYLIYFRKHFSFTPKFSLLAIGTGLLIAILWVGLDSFYPHISPAEALTYSTIDIILKLCIGVLLAPIIEEFFTRYFFHRFLTKKNWLRVKQGTYVLTPFIITTLFFGFSHSRWLVGLISGVLFNLLWYKEKNMSSIVIAHAIANFLLGLFVIISQSYAFW